MRTYDYGTTDTGVGDGRNSQGILIEEVEERKGEMFGRQQFLDACQDAGVEISRVGRNWVKDAPEEAWTDFLAALLVTAVGSESVWALINEILGGEK